MFNIGDTVIIDNETRLTGTIIEIITYEEIGDDFNLDPSYKVRVFNKCYKNGYFDFCREAENLKRLNK